MARAILTVRERVFPLKTPFRISRGVKSEARLIRAEIAHGKHRGIGFACPYPRYGETVGGVLQTVASLKAQIERGLTREGLQKKLKPGAARNALDLALWDLEAKRSGKTVAERLGLNPPQTFATMRTVVIGSPEEMAAAAAGHPRGAVLKIKLGRTGVEERLATVRKAAPSSKLVVDANEAWDAALLERLFPKLKGLGVVLLEQPLPAGDDAALSKMPHPVPVCADESCHTAADLPRLEGRYEAVNVKLDKAGGLTAALELHEKAKRAGFKTMLGCMVANADAVAPLALLAGEADFVDLDGPLLLAKPGRDGMEEIAGTDRVRLTVPWGR